MTQSSVIVASLAFCIRTQLTSRRSQNSTGFSSKCFGFQTTQYCTELSRFSSNNTHHRKRNGFSTASPWTTPKQLFSIFLLDESSLDSSGSCSGQRPSPSSVHDQDDAAIPFGYVSRLGQRRWGNAMEKSTITDVNQSEITEKHFTSRTTTSSQLYKGKVLSKLSSRCPAAPG